MNVGFVYHLCIQSDFDRLKTEDSYQTQDLAETGFIHCCTKQQMSGVLDRFFNEEQELIALKINPSKLKAKIVYELSDQQLELFPHIYGCINLNSVEEITSINYNDFVINR